MTDEHKSDFAQFLRELRLQHAHEQKPQAEKERAPDYFQRKTEREGHSNWSGGSMGGGTFAGRARGEREQ